MCLIGKTQLLCMQCRGIGPRLVARFPREGNGSTLQYSYLENPLDKRILVDYSPWGHKELDTHALS